MKKITILFLSIFICLNMIGCADNNNNNSGSSTSSSDNSSSSNNSSMDESGADLITFGELTQQYISYDGLNFPATSLDSKKIVAIDTNKDSRFKTIYGFSKTTGLDEYIQTLSAEQLATLKNATYISISETNTSDVKTVYFGNTLLQTDTFSDSDRITLFQEAGNSNFFTEYDQKCGWTSDLQYSCSFGGINSNDRSFTVFTFTNPNLTYRNFANISDTVKYN